MSPSGARPDLVERLVLISTAMQPEAWIMRPEPPDPADPLADLPDERVESYRLRSPDGTERLAHVLERAAALSASGHAVSLDRFRGRVLVMAGDDDLVTLESQLDLYRSARRAELAILPHASHDVPREHPDLVTAVVRAFLDDDRAPTHIPVPARGPRPRRVTAGVGGC